MGWWSGHVNCKLYFGPSALVGPVREHWLHWARTAPIHRWWKTWLWRRLRTDSGGWYRGEPEEAEKRWWLFGAFQWYGGVCVTAELDMCVLGCWGMCIWLWCVRIWKITVVWGCNINTRRYKFLNSVILSCCPAFGTLCFGAVLLWLIEWSATEWKL